MEQNQVIDEINYYKAQAITELLYFRLVLLHIFTAVSLP